MQSGAESAFARMSERHFRCERNFCCDIADDIARASWHCKSFGFGNVARVVCCLALNRVLFLLVSRCGMCWVMQMHDWFVEHVWQHCGACLVCFLLMMFFLRANLLHDVPPWACVGNVIV